MTMTSLALLALALGACAEPETTYDLAPQEQAIIGGISDTNHRYVVGVGGTFSAFCSGTVISRRTVITAGHCTSSQVKSIFLGPTLGAQAQRVAVKTAIRHPMYAPLPNDNATYDLGILELETDAPVQAVPLLRATLDNSPVYIGPKFTFVGYGRSSPNGGGFGTKRVATFPITTVGPADVGGSFGFLPDTLFYYTGTGGKNTCNGDSGGPAFYVTGGVEYHAGVTSAGDASCMLDGSQGRTDQPFIDGFIQAHIDEFEGDDPCRSNGVCDESCNHDGQLGDPDCAVHHCSADGICAEACVAPRDPDCSAVDTSNCGDNGVCDPGCPTPDPDCIRDCGAEGNCIPGCATPDPDCAIVPPPPPDAGVPPPPDTDAGTTEPAPPDAGPHEQPDAGIPDGEASAAGGGCTCSIHAGRAATDRRGPAWLALPLVLLVRLRRKRQAR